MSRETELRNKIDDLKDLAGFKMKELIVQAKEREIESYKAGELLVEIYDLIKIASELERKLENLQQT